MRQRHDLLFGDPIAGPSHHAAARCFRSAHPLPPALHADPDGRDVDRDISHSTLCCALYGGVLCHRIAGHASLARVEAGRSAGRHNTGSDAGDGVHSAGCVAGVCRAASFPALQLASATWASVWHGPGHVGVARAQVASELEKLPGKQLIIVRYSADHSTFDDWVYNAPDIDNAKVIWAREMSDTDNLELIRYYKDRRVWLVQPDLQPARLSPYPPPGTETLAQR